jgi:selenocysteine-specific elongation factor
MGVPRAQVADVLNRSDLERIKAGTETCFVAARTIDHLVEAVRDQLLTFHAEEPKALGIAVPALRDRVRRGMPERVFDAVLALAVSRGVAVVDKGLVHHPEAAASAMAAEADAQGALLGLLRGQGLAPAGVAELASAAGVDAQLARRALGALASAGEIVRLNSELHFSAEAIAGARAALVAHLEASGTATAAALRDALGVSRKYAIPLLEYFDAQGVTKRVGDERTLKR